MWRTTNLVAALAAVMVLMGTGCTYLKSRDQLTKGIANYRNAKYGDAVENFKTAIALDPSSPMPRLYLATSYMVQWIPGAESPENIEFAKNAQQEFLKVLDQDPKEKTALASLAMIAYNEAGPLPLDQKLAKYDEAAKWQKRRIEVDPNEKEAYYSLGVIDYAKWVPALMLARSNLHMKIEDPGPLKDKKMREELKAQYGPIVDDGIQDLQKALEIDPEYDQAMSYLSILIRQKADLLDSSEAYKQQIDIADGWQQKVMDTKKIKTERAAKSHQGAITTDSK
jgi:tetratricopeptide (TPR) repeat protein